MTSLISSDDQPCKTTGNSPPRFLPDLELELLQPIQLHARRGKGKGKGRESTKEAETRQDAGTSRIPLIYRQPI